MRVLALILSLAPAMTHAEIFEDFRSGGAGWQYFSDQVMGGVSDGAAALATEGETAFARLTGTVSIANNGGFIQIRRPVAAGFDAESNGVTLRVRGNGERYFVHLRTSRTRLPWQYFQASFSTSETWTSVTLPWDAFAPSGPALRKDLAPTDIRSIGVVAYGRDHAADVSIAEIVID